MHVLRQRACGLLYVYASFDPRPHELTSILSHFIHEQKTATAVAFVKDGRGLINVNGAPIENVEPELLRYKILEPVLLLNQDTFSKVGRCVCRHNPRGCTRGGGSCVRCRPVCPGDASVNVRVTTPLIPLFPLRLVSCRWTSACG